MKLGDSLARYSFAWMSPGLVDWTTLTFRPTITEYVMFNNKLLDSYKARWKQVHSVRNCFLEIDQLAGVLEKSARKTSSRAIRSIFEHFHLLCIRAYRHDV